MFIFGKRNLFSRYFNLFKENKMKMKFTATEERIKSENAAYWDKLKVTIWQEQDNGIQKEIGNYTRNYSSYGISTFHPFKIKDQWYALYSKDYTCTRVMTLPDCKDWCGEEPNSFGFCSVEYYIPEFQETPLDNEKTYKSFITSEFDSSQEIFYYDLAFVAGCVWGDDSSWKIEAFDLSQIENKILTRFQPFGYMELSPGKLKDLLDISGNRFEIKTTKVFWRDDKVFQGDVEYLSFDKGEISKYGELILSNKNPHLVYRADQDFIDEIKNLEISIDPEKVFIDSLIGKSKQEVEKIFIEQNKKYIFVNQQNEGFISYPSQKDLPSDQTRYFCTLKKDTDVVCHITFR